jgi:hypothetical protein
LKHERSRVGVGCLRLCLLLPRLISSELSEVVADGGKDACELARCLVECLPALQHDPNRPEDVLKVDCDEDGGGGDDTADCLRYLVATKARVIVQRRLRGV